VRQGSVIGALNSTPKYQSLVLNVHHKYSSIANELRIIHSDYRDTEHYILHHVLRAENVMMSTGHRN
jgi:hypothetical protein